MDKNRRTTPQPFRQPGPLSTASGYAISASIHYSGSRWFIKLFIRQKRAWTAGMTEAVQAVARSDGARREYSPRRKRWEITLAAPCRRTAESIRDLQLAKYSQQLWSLQVRTTMPTDRPMGSSSAIIATKPSSGPIKTAAYRLTEGVYQHATAGPQTVLRVEMLTRWKKSMAKLVRTFAEAENGKLALSLDPCPTWIITINAASVGGAHILRRRLMKQLSRDLWAAQIRTNIPRRADHS